jgi:hypothetical protein
MAEVQRTKRVTAGDWRTLESGWNATFTCLFLAPSGAEIKIRYGGGWIFGKDSQHQTLDGIHTKALNVGRASLAYARVQMKVRSDADVTYAYVASGP